MFSQVHCLDELCVFVYLCLCEFPWIIWSFSPSFISWRLYTSYICPYAQRVWIARNYKVVPNFDLVCSAKFFFFFLFLIFPNWNIIYFCVQGLQEKIKLVPIDLEDRPSWYKEQVYPPNKVTISTTLVFSLCSSYLFSLAVTLRFYSFIICKVLFGCQDRYWGPLLWILIESLLLGFYLCLEKPQATNTRTYDYLPVNSSL